MTSDPTMDDCAATTSRRVLLQALAAAGLLGLAGEGIARAANAPGWPAAVFSKKNEQDAMKALFGEPYVKSDKIKLDVPEIAENGAVVPVTVTSSLPKASSINILVPNNPFTVAASYHLPPGTAAAISSRLKMAKTSYVIAVVESEGKIYGAAKQVKVTLGGCGG